MNAPALRCHILDTGYCTASEHHVLRGGRRKTIECHSLVGLLHHPQQGWILWDTGYAPRIWTATQSWPFWLYRRVTPLHIPPELAVVNQLGRFGISPSDIRWVILSHFHADHLAGLRDFPDARPVALREAFDEVAQRRGFAALRRAFLPSLLPDDFVQRALLLEQPNGPALPALGPSHDLFADGSLLLIPLPGHARGQIGLLANTDRGRILFAADGAWTSQSIREQRPPHPVTHAVIDDVAAMHATLNRLHTFHTACPEISLVPTHCPEAYEREVVKRGEWRSQEPGARIQHSEFRIQK